MSTKYRVKLTSGRVVGPFYLNQVGDLFKKGHVSGKELIQTFPGGEWLPVKRHKEIFNLFLSISEGKNTKDRTRASKTLANIVASKNKSENKPDKTITDINNPIESNSKNDTLKSDNDLKEFSFSRNSQASGPSYDELEKKYQQKKQQLDQSSIDTEKTKTKSKTKHFDKTVIKTSIAKNDKYEKTVLLNPQSNDENLTETVGAPADVDLDNDESTNATIEEPLQEVIDYDGSTEFIDLSAMLPEIKKTADSAEKDLVKSLKQNEVDDIEKPTGDTPDIDEEEDDEDEDDEIDDNSKKKKMKPMVAFVFMIIIYFIAFDDDGSKKEKIEPRRPKIVFPISAEFENEEKSTAAFEKGLKLYKRGSYLTKLFAAEKFRESLFHKFKNNPALGYLILTYAEFLPNVSNKREAGKTLFRLIKISRSKALKDINVALGTAIFYYNFDNYLTAKRTMENFLNISKPTIKFFAWYLQVCIKSGDIVSARKVVEKLEPVKKKDLEAYLFMANFYEVNEEPDKSKKLLEEAGKIYSKSVDLLLRYADHALRDEEKSKYKKILEAIYDLNAEGSPYFYAKYLEHMGILSILLDKTDIALQYFKLALKIRESDELRSKLAALQLGGSKSVESLILESKIKELMRKARIERDKKSWISALRYAVDAADLSLTYIPSQLLLADIQVKRGFFDSAIKTLLDIREEHPTNIRVNYHLVNAYINSFKLIEAQKEINNFTRSKFAQSSEYASLLGRFYMKSDKILLAIKWLQEAVNRNPLSSEDYFLLAKIFLSHRKYQQGRQMLSEAISLEPDNLEFRSLYGTILYELNDAETAIGYLREILEKNPEHPKLLGDIATYYYKSGQMKEFEIYKKKISNLIKKDRSFYEFLINSAKLDDNVEDVIKYSRKLVSFEPGDLQTRMELSQYLFNLNKFQDALKELEGVRNRLPSYPKVHFFIAKCYIELGELDKALEFANLEIKNNPGLEHGYYALGEVYKRQKDWPTAIKNLEIALSKNPKSADSLGSLAEIRFFQKQYPTAREMYLRAIKEDSSRAHLHKGLGMVYKKSGQSKLAKEEFKLYLDLMPNAVDKLKIQAEIKNLR